MMAMMASKQSPHGEAVSPTVETPPSRAAIAARKPEVLLDTPKDFFRSMRVRNQLLLGYGMMAMLSFGALIGICTTLTTVVSNTVISVSTRELTFQIVNNSKATMQETALVLDARLSEGFSVLVQPTAFALFDLIGGDSSLTPLISYGEPSTSELKPPLSYDDRWHCVSTVNDATTGCNSVTRKQQISLGASSVYITGSSTSGDGFDTADAATWLHINRSTVVDLFVKNAWKDMEAWLDVYIAGLSSSAMLRQYPGSVGNLETASVGSTTRTYDPSSKGWYTDVAPADGSFKLAEKTTGEYLEQRPRTISSPYLSDFGRGYLLSISGPLAGPSGTVEGVIGADIAVNSLQSLVTTIKSRETGEAHFFERATGLVVASRQLDASFTVTKIPTINDLTLPGENNKHTIRQLTDPAEGAPVGGDGYSLLTDADFVFDAAGGGSMSRVDPDGAEYQLVWQQAWDGNFVLLTVTPTEEIQRPISSQLTRIRAYSTNTILVSLFLCLGCLVVVVLLVIRMSVQISKPIVDTVRQSTCACATSAPISSKASPSRARPRGSRRNSSTKGSPRFHRCKRRSRGSSSSTRARWLRCEANSSRRSSCSTRSACASRRRRHPSPGWRSRPGGCLSSRLYWPPPRRRTRPSWPTFSRSEAIPSRSARQRLSSLPMCSR